MKRNWFLVMCCALAAMALASCSRTEFGPASSVAASTNASASWTVRVATVPSPAGANGSNPQMAVSDRAVLLSWVERTGGSTTTLKFAERTPSGWTTPTTVSAGNNWSVNYADSPAVFRRRDGSLVANWLVSTDRRQEGSDLQLTYSKDNGKTWARSFLPHHDGTRGQHAFPSFFELPGGALGLVWLDARAQAANPEDLEASISLRYAAFDQSWKQTADSQVDARVCECCSTAAAVTAEGVVVAFRDRSDKEIRDIAVSRLERGRWTPSTTVHDDGWEIEACPVNGPALSARARLVVIAWFTVKNGQGRAWAAFSSNSGRTWGTPIRLDDAGSIGRVGVALLDDGSAAATWVERNGERSEFRVRRVDPSGVKSAPFTVAGVPGGSASGFPRMARHASELVFAWTEHVPDANSSENASVLKTAVAQLPPTR